MPPAAPLRPAGAIVPTLAAGPRSIILGPNGAGKSLLLRICHGLHPADRRAVAWRAPGIDARGGRRWCSSAR